MYLLSLSLLRSKESLYDYEGCSSTDLVFACSLNTVIAVYSYFLLIFGNFSSGLFLIICELDLLDLTIDFSWFYFNYLR